MSIKLYKLKSTTKSKFKKIKYFLVFSFITEAKKGIIYLIRKQSITQDTVRKHKNI